MVLEGRPSGRVGHRRNFDEQPPSRSDAAAGALASRTSVRSQSTHPTVIRGSCPTTGRVRDHPPAAAARPRGRPPPGSRLPASPLRGSPAAPCAAVMLRRRIGRPIAAARAETTGAVDRSLTHLGAGAIASVPRTQRPVVARPLDRNSQVDRSARVDRIARAPAGTAEAPGPEAIGPEAIGPEAIGPEAIGPEAIGLGAAGAVSRNRRRSAATGLVRTTRMTVTKRRAGVGPTKRLVVVTTTGGLRSEWSARVPNRPSRSPSESRRSEPRSRRAVDAGPGRPTSNRRFRGWPAGAAIACSNV